MATFKGRFCARGDQQQEGPDYHADALFAPTVRRDTIRAMTHIGAQQGWHFELMDVVGAYLFADLEEEVYMQQPQGFIDPTNPIGVCLLKKAIYGLKQSARAWYGRLKDYLLTLGFIVNPVDSSLFQRKLGGEWFFVEVYVDDLGLLTSSLTHVAQYKEAMSREFKMKAMTGIPWGLTSSRRG